MPTRLPTPTDILGAVLLGASTPTAAPVAQLIELASIQTDGGAQMRAGLNEDTINEYAEAIASAENSWPFPPVILFYDGTTYWLADGFHRISAARRLVDFAGQIPADVRSGTRRDAVLYAAGANASHGLRRTKDDKRRAVTTLLHDAEWVQWSDREIARRCNVHHQLVATLRLSLDDHPVSERTYTTKHGTTATMQTANIGAPTPPKPPASTTPVLPTWVTATTGDYVGFGDQVGTPPSGRNYVPNHVTAPDPTPEPATITLPFDTLYADLGKLRAARGAMTDLHDTDFPGHQIEIWLAITDKAIEFINEQLDS